MKVSNIEMYSGPEHAMYSLIIMGIFVCVFFLIGTNIWISSALVAISHYWGREQMNAESKLNNIGVPMFPWQWHKKSQWDFYVPLVVCLFVALMFMIL